MYIRDPAMPARLAAEHPLLYRFLLNKWYFDELYDLIFVRPALRLGRFLWRTGDGRIIDGLGPDGVSARVIDVTRGVVRLQTGYVYHYAFAMLIGVAGADHLLPDGRRTRDRGRALMRLGLHLPRRLPRSPSPLVGEDRRGRSPSEEGGRHEFPGRASGFDGTAGSAPPAFHARRPPSPLGLPPESALPPRGRG